MDLKSWLVTGLRVAGNVWLFVYAFIQLFLGAKLAIWLTPQIGMLPAWGFAFIFWMTPAVAMVLWCDQCKAAERQRIESETFRKEAG